MIKSKSHHLAGSKACNGSIIDFLESKKAHDFWGLCIKSQKKKREDSKLISSLSSRFPDAFYGQQGQKTCSPAFSFLERGVKNFSLISRHVRILGFSTDFQRR